MSDKLFCAPDIKSNGVTCYSKKDLLFLVKSYNQNKEEKDKILISTSKKKIMVRLK